MFIQRIPDGLVQSNTYIIADKKQGEGVLIDCGCPPERIQAVIQRNGLTVRQALITHGHFDHIYYIDRLKKQMDIQVAIHEQEADYLADPQLNGLAYFPVGDKKVFNPADKHLKDGDILECGKLKLKILHTPGHTRGGICILVNQYVFTGDTLFMSSIGRTDFPGGSMTDIKKSIQEKLFTLSEDIVVYPGHGNTTTIGYEMKNNPFVRL